MAQFRRTVVTIALNAAAILASSACAGGDDSEAATPTPSAASSGQPDSVPAAAPNGQPTAAGATPPPPPTTEGISVMTGVYTREQATRGAQVYAASCGQCHTMGQHSGSRFEAAWNNRKLYDLHEIIRNTMPVDNPGGLTDQEYLDVVAYMLHLNGIPAGKSALDNDPATLKGLRIEVRPTKGP